MRLRLMLQSLGHGLRQVSTSAKPLKDPKSRIFVEPMSIAEKIAPFGFIFFFCYVTGGGLRRNCWGYVGNGWIGEVWRLGGKHWGYRQPIKEQIREQKRQEVAAGRDWSYRIWLN